MGWCRVIVYGLVTVVVFITSWLWLPSQAIHAAALVRQDEISEDKVTLGSEVQVLLEDGRIFKGVLAEKNLKYVILKIAGIKTTFNAIEVIEIIPVKTFETHYMEMKEQINDDDLEGRYQLCVWIYGRRKFKLASVELDSFLRDFPGHEPAEKLLRLASAELEIIESHNTAQKREADNTVDDDAETLESTDDSDVATPTEIAKMRLTKEQINLIRLYEVDLENPPRILISRSTIDTLLRQYPDSDLLPQTASERRKFYRKEPAEVLKIIFDLKARHLYPEIRVLSEPESFRSFRMDIHRTWLINSCASMQCHGVGGGVDSGKLRLFNQDLTSPETVYSNFMILNNTSIDTDDAGRGSISKQMIDYSNPKKSLLIEMGLPRMHVFKGGHPEVEGWKPIFRNPKDPMLQKCIDWIESMYRPRPTYPVEYIPPGLRKDEKSDDESEKTDEETDTKEDPDDDPGR